LLPGAKHAELMMITTVFLGDNFVPFQAVTVLMADQEQPRAFCYSIANSIRRLVQKPAAFHLHCAVTFFERYSYFIYLIYITAVLKSFT